MTNSPNRVLRLILGWTLVTAGVAWIIVVRSVSQPGYEWGLFGLTGPATSGDFWTVLLVSVVGFAMVYFGWRGAPRLFHWMLLAWHWSLASLVVYGTWTLGGQARWRGDTWGLDISAGWSIPLFLGIAVLALFWVVRDLRSGREPTPLPWTRTNRTLLRLAFALVPFQFVLFHFGEVHGWTDKLAVIVTIAQVILFGEGLKPRLDSQGNQVSEQPTAAGS